MTAFDQRMRALEIANEVRISNARTIRTIRSQRYADALRHVADLVEANQAPFSSMPVWRAVRSVPKLGEVRARRLLTDANVLCWDRRVRQLTDRQRSVLASRLRQIADDHRPS